EGRHPIRNRIHICRARCGSSHPAPFQLQNTRRRITTMNKPKVHWSFRAEPGNIDIPRVLREMREAGQSVVLVTIEGTKNLFVLQNSPDIVSRVYWGRHPTCETFFRFNAKNNAVEIKGDPIAQRGPLWYLVQGE